MMIFAKHRKFSYRIIILFIRISDVDTSIPVYQQETCDPLGIVRA